MYTESEFMDMSLQSRLGRINEEVAKLTLWLVCFQSSIFKNYLITIIKN
jgi:hypothetical protein